jgi:predicted RNase H-like HicB family nuclease
MVPRESAIKPMNIQFTIRTFKEGRSFVAHAIDLDVSSCGGTREKALKNLHEAVTLLLEEAETMGTLTQILEECGYSRSGKQIRSREFFSVQRVPLPDSLT